MKRKLNLAFSLSLFSLTIFAQTSDFNEKPWTKEIYPIIIDPYHSNDIDFEKLIKDKRVVGIIHKASEGLNIDVKYIERSKISKSKGLLYASYHLGTKGKPKEQADFYLNTIKDNLDEPMALDIEDIGGNNISLKDAEDFITEIYKKTNKYPFVYINNKVFNEINKKLDHNSIFSKCPLWYARFVPTLPNLNNKIWKKVSLWQFSSEINSCKCKCIDKKCSEINGKIKYTKEYNPDCSSGNKSNCAGSDNIHYCSPYKINGTDCDIDINVFNGNISDLNSFWDIYKGNKNFEIDAFLSQNVDKSISIKKQLLGNNYRCHVKETYYVETYTDGKISDRFIVYKKDNKFNKSIDFLNWAYSKVKYDDDFKDALNRVDVKYLGNNTFNFNYNLHNDQFDGGNLDLKFTENGYNFPETEECHN